MFLPSTISFSSVWNTFVYILHCSFFTYKTHHKYHLVVLLTAILISHLYQFLGTLSIYYNYFWIMSSLRSVKVYNIKALA